MPQENGIERSFFGFGPLEQTDFQVLVTHILDLAEPQDDEEIESLSTLLVDLMGEAILNYIRESRMEGPDD